MEQINQILKRQQVGTTLQKSSKSLLKKQDNEYSLSTYSGELTQESIVKSVAKVKAAFPALPKEFYSVFIERLREKGFTDERLKDAVNNVIDNCQYPTPTLANFLSFDKRVKLYSYSEMCSKVQPGMSSTEIFDKIKIDGNLFWVRKSDKAAYNLPNEI